MFKIIDYFVAGNAYGTYSNLVIMFMFMSVMVIISVTLLAKTWILLRKTSNDANKYLLRTMLGILLLNLGEWSLTVTELITGQKWGIFSIHPRTFNVFGHEISIRIAPEFGSRR